MINSPVVDEAPTIPMYHKKCNGVAFYTVGKLQVGDVLRASKIRLPNGSIPLVGSIIRCSSCGDIFAGISVRGVEYRD